jgi:predicted nucleic acid-binding protein
MLGGCGRSGRDGAPASALTSCCSVIVHGSALLLVEMALYLDTSCLLKLFFPEPETARTLALVAAEPQVIVSSLARLESLSQIHARVTGGLLSPTRARQLRQRLEAVLKLAPYEQVPCPADVIDSAAAQIKVAAKTGYCRTLDRLHLSTMHGLGIQRLLTNDDTQAAAARALGMEVVLPR